MADERQQWQDELAAGKGREKFSRYPEAKVNKLPELPKVREKVKLMKIGEPLPAGMPSGKDKTGKNTEKWSDELQQDRLSQRMAMLQKTMMKDPRMKLAGAVIGQERLNNLIIGKSVSKWIYSLCAASFEPVSGFFSANAAFGIWVVAFLMGDKLRSYGIPIKVGFLDGMAASFVFAMWWAIVLAIVILIATIAYCTPSLTNIGNTIECTAAIFF
ncbi:MAG: hypothetical protein NUV82_00070 [Candidatus Komeilibacteria bacterium]|nr:hypothetical protein [Candidatus Komeilibacteria bacterium]